MAVTNEHDYNLRLQQQQYQQRIQTAAHSPAQGAAKPKPAMRKDGKISMKHNHPPPPLVMKSEKKSYTRKNVLGEGGFAVCYEVVDEKGNTYAAKVVNKQSLKGEKQRSKLIGEIKIQKSLHHQNIVRFYDVFEDSENVYMIIEICRNMTLVELLKKRKRLTEPEVRFYMLQLIAATIYMHKKHVIHRDLKLGNLLLDDNMDLKIADFGLAAMIEHEGERKKTICGTPNYIAPEVLFDSGNGHSYEVDIWSLGVIMYTLLVGKPPFQTREVEAIYKKIKENNYSFPPDLDISNDAKNLISQILDKVPENRPSLEEMRQHPFLTAQPIPKSIPKSAFTTIPTFEDERPPFTNITNVESNKANEYDEEDKKTKDEESKSKKSNSKKETPRGYFARCFTGSSRGPSERNHMEPAKAKALNQKYARANINKHKNQVATSGNILDIVYRNICQAFEDNENNVEPPEVTEPIENPKVFISKWIDYSNKYGLGYQLTNSCVGVYFNDSTSIILSADEEHFEYLYYTKENDQPVMQKAQYTLENYPSDLHKKVTLLKHFKVYMNENLYKASTYSFVDKERKEDLDFLTKYLRTKRAVIFRLSNKVVQVNFFDHTKLMFSGDGNIVSFVDRNRVMKSYNLLEFIKMGDVDEINRLNYIKSILEQLTLRKQRKMQQ
ncbi:Pkinase-domain-containing protein [Neocallimastix californiae]|uniref:Serine/threonine-protein kinase n=1 Tax=Neocallimastix californiae TaxID=1754190 RepID=A0A1Y2E9C0_9FUNG|nr:Pkinase-domain-containing protein [Neocallimastix californiae]|eukprot:ORY68139.1 Pkinase-domain-containing protein [Neocallimastix californiae]